MTPEQRFFRDLQQGTIMPDLAQRQALALLQDLFQRIETRLASKPSGFARILESLVPRTPVASANQGLYLWGGVGRGKTYLMDIFCEALPPQVRLRTHFHRFMQRVHGELTLLKGQKNPLQLIAHNFSRQVRLICFDEFFVQDIGDAMILAGLLEALFKEGMVLVMTSNSHPDTLYTDGLQRERFLPAISMIKDRMQVVELAGGTDYRLRQLIQARLYHWPLGPDADQQLAESFRNLAPDPDEAIEREVIEILGRPIVTRYCGDDVVWLDFARLCDGPRSAFDYIELARLFHAVLLSNVPLLDSSRDDQARRFVNLVDELYDHRVKLIISAAVPLDQLYQGTALAREFQRTYSRLQEMQSQDYLSSAHKP